MVMLSATVRGLESLSNPQRTSPGSLLLIVAAPGGFGLKRELFCLVAPRGALGFQLLGLFFQRLPLGLELLFFLRQCLVFRFQLGGLAALRLLRTEFLSLTALGGPRFLLGLQI